MIAANQGRIFLHLFEELRPHLRKDRNLPSRIQQRLAGEKRFGSRDRRLYRELLYTAIRYLPWIEEKLASSTEEALRAVVQLSADQPALQALRQAVGITAAAPFSVAEKAALLGASASPLPEWFRESCPAAFASPDLDFLHARPSLWLRLQTGDAGPVLDEFASRGWRYRSFGDSSPVESEALPAPTRRPIPLGSAIELLSEADVTKTEAFLRGLIEVQDLGSQLLLESVRPAPGGHWLDACAGAGGKTLQLAGLLGPAGRVEAWDPRVTALDELRARAKRAGLSTISVLRSPPAPTQKYDGVLVDAPCSGTGTWRRSPHLKWCTGFEEVLRSANLQKEILQAGAKFVRPGGLVVYTTCSLACQENAEIAHAFLASNPDFSPAPATSSFRAQRDACGGLTFMPSLHNTDGFYVATFARNT